MKTLTKAVRRAGGRTLISDQRGLSTVEYVIILVLIAVLCIGVWKAFGSTIQGKIGGSRDRINDLSTEDQPPPETL
jgi:Flp pilus assembly pilin Flp